MHILNLSVLLFQHCLLEGGKKLTVVPLKTSFFDKNISFVPGTSNKYCYIKQRQKYTHYYNI